MDEIKLLRFFRIRNLYHVNFDLIFRDYLILKALK